MGAGHDEALPRSSLWRVSTYGYRQVTGLLREEGWRVSISGSRKLFQRAHHRNWKLF